MKEFPSRPSPTFSSFLKKKWYLAKSFDFYKCSSKDISHWATEKTAIRGKTTCPVFQMGKWYQWPLLKISTVRILSIAVALLSSAHAHHWMLNCSSISLAFFYSNYCRPFICTFCFCLFCFVFHPVVLFWLWFSHSTDTLQHWSLVAILNYMVANSFGLSPKWKYSTLKFLLWTLKNSV